MGEFEVNKKKIASNTIALYVRMAISMVISFFAMRVTLQQLGVDDYGLNNLVGSVVALFSFINGSMGTAVQRFYNVEIGKSGGVINQLKKIVGVALYLHIWVAIITTILAEIFAIFFLYRLNIPVERQTAAQVVFQVSIVSLNLDILLVPYSALLRAREMFAKMATVEIGQSILRLVVLFLLVNSTYDKLITLSVLNLCVTILYAGIIFIMSRQFQETHCCPCREKGIINEMLKFISMLVLSLFAQVFKDKGIVIIINLFYGLALNAAYAVAMQVSQMVNTFVLNFQQSVVPQLISSYGAGDKKTMVNLINFGTKISAILLLMVSLPIIVESEYIITLWLKTPPEHASGLVSLIMVNIVLFSFEYFLAQGVHATGNLVRLQTYCSIAFLSSVAFMYVFCKLGFNYYMPMYINIICSVAVVIVSLIEAHRLYDYSISYFVFRLFFPAICVGLLTVSILYGITILLAPGLLRLFFVVGMGVLLMSVLGLFVILDSKERQQLYQLFLSRHKAAYN